MAASYSDALEMYYYAVLVLFSPILELCVPVLLGVAAIKKQLLTCVSLISMYLLLIGTHTHINISKRHP